MKAREITLYRQVAHTVDGVTRTVTEPYTVQVPQPPRDWDRIVLAAVSALVGAMVVASVVWSTTSVGGLLARAVLAPVAYTAAGVFDAAWIACLAVEWLSRYDARKAVLPRRAGHLALLLAMAAVGANGWLTGSIAVGLVGATISAIAKGVWTVLMRFYAKPLDPLTEQWVEQELSQAGARLAMLPVRRQLARAEGLLAAERTALQLTAPEPPTPVEAAVEAPAPLAVDRADGTARAAIRAAADTMPDATTDEIVTQLARLGITVTTAAVEQVLQPVTGRVPTPPTPVADARLTVIRELYDGGSRPTTSQMRDALVDAGHGHLGDSTVRGLRLLVEQAEPHLAQLPSPITVA